MSPEQREHLAAIRDALSRAREADERLRSALAEATVWTSIAITDDDDHHRGTGAEGDPA